jgi:hypothetical protein
MWLIKTCVATYLCPSHVTSPRHRLSPPHVVRHVSAVHASVGTPSLRQVCVSCRYIFLQRYVSGSVCAWQHMPHACVAQVCPCLHPPCAGACARASTCPTLVRHMFVRACTRHMRVTMIEISGVQSASLCKSRI